VALSSEAFHRKSVGVAAKGSARIGETELKTPSGAPRRVRYVPKSFGRTDGDAASLSARLASIQRRSS